MLRKDVRTMDAKRTQLGQSGILYTKHKLFFKTEWFVVSLRLDLVVED